MFNERMESKPPMLNVVELFAGIGGFRIAADELGLKTVFANDFNPLACTAYRNQFGATPMHEGDIAELLDSVPPHDLLTAGFPCQPFSAAGKKEGIRDPRGTLFQIIVDVLSQHRPRYFVLENVKRLLTMEDGEHFATVLTALAELDYVIEWRVLNARDFGLAQNRERVFVIGERISVHHQKFAIAPKLATVEDIRSDRRVGSALEAPRAWPKLATHDSRFPSWGLVNNDRFIASDLEVFSEAQPDVMLRDILEAEPAAEYDLTAATIGRLGVNQPVDRFVNGVEILSNQSGGARMGYTIFGVSGLAPTLTASTSRHYERYFVDGRYRRLTPVEYARLQGFPDGHCDGVRGYDQYTLYGNAVPPPMAKWAIARAIRMPISSERRQTRRQEDLLHALQS
jgi:DNA (cytosine-5)-methyltransferase 1